MSYKDLRAKVNVVSISPERRPVIPRVLSLFTLSIVTLLCTRSVADDRIEAIELDQTFQTEVLPFLESCCLECHGTQTQEAKLDLSGYLSASDVSKSHQIWDLVLERVQAGEMPPSDARKQPSSQQRETVVAWIGAAREFEANRSAGDPGPVLARRLSNAEYNYSIRDLTGVDIRPTATFPVDPANEAGFDNTGESLTMSPALLEKYLDAARTVVAHMMLTPDGIAFAPHPVVTDTDRDKYCVRRIVQFYQQQPTDLADYFFAAWQFRCRSKSRDIAPALEEIAVELHVSPKYLTSVWALLTDEEGAVGPVAWLQSKWQELPADDHQSADARFRCEQMRNDVNQLRGKLMPKFDNLYIEGNHKGSQPFVLWKNRQHAANRQSYDRQALIVTETSLPEPLAAQADDAPRVDNILHIPADENERLRYEIAFDRFCSVFPDVFYVSERGRDYVNDSQKQDGEKGRLLSAGFHSMMGYFRDDGPLCNLILNETQRQELDSLWFELDYIASAPMRQYVGFLWFERTDSRFMRDEQFDFARAEDRDAQSAAMIRKLAEVYIEKARRSGGGPVEIEAIQLYFHEINQQIRQVEEARTAAEPLHLKAALTFAARACRRPLSPAEREELDSYYRTLRDRDELTHEEAVQDVIVSVLMSPHFCYRMDLPTVGEGRQPLNDFELAGRLSYFLWSSLPDDELLEQASNGQLNQPEVLVAEVRRMLRDDRIRGLATEFGGHWLDFRRFEEHNSVDRERFPQFTDELRRAMFEEPVRFFVDLVQRDGSVNEFLSGNHTFVNGVLAKHYGLPFPSEHDEEWMRIDEAAQYGRGGLLPMAVFLTKNAPGLRTSPVKRGYWVVRQLLGQRIPPPPPSVPDLPEDEARLGELTLREALSRHRENKSCAVCHDRIDPYGLVFEGFGPVGERRDMDLAGRSIDTNTTLPDGQQANGIDDLKIFLREQRGQEFVDHLCRKLLSYGLGRSLILSDELLIREIQRKMKDEDDRFGCLVESIVTSPQFTLKRGSRACSGRTNP